MKTEIANEKLQEFLESKGFLSLFLEEVRRQKQDRLLSHPQLAISSALTWSMTRQGGAFWRRLSREFNGGDNLSIKDKYEIKKLSNGEGFSIGCQRFTYSDIIDVASMIVEERNFTPISDRRMVFAEYDEDGRTTYRLMYMYASYKRTFTKETVNYILSMIYHLKTI